MFNFTGYHRNIKVFDPVIIYIFEVMLKLPILHTLLVKVILLSCSLSWVSRVRNVLKDKYSSYFVKYLDIVWYSIFPYKSEYITLVYNTI